MARERSHALLSFHDVTFAPGTNVIKAADRHLWVELEQLRPEARARIEQEIAAATAAACEAVERRSDELVAERVARLTEAFAKAAGEMEQAAIDLAVRIAERVIQLSAPEAFFARAAEHLQALVPDGSALRVRVHPEATGALAGFCERLTAAGVHHVNVVADASLPEPRSLVVETRDGEIDLSFATQVKRIGDAVAREFTADDEAEAQP